tara:strand:+ start:360 stop:725 length:366 start_codon:yes stop_codon:yes gene_type:complete
MAWQDEYLVKCFHTYCKTRTENQNDYWEYYYGYYMGDLANLVALGGESAYGRRIHITRENVVKIVDYLIDTGPNNTNVNKILKTFRTAMKPYLFKVIYNSRKVKYNEMVHQMDNGSTESNS